MQAVYCVTGIDTDVGKTVVTGAIAKWLKNNGILVTTQKIAQTGCVDIAEDIVAHRAMMHEPLNDFDLAKITCPYVFPKPASPHLAAEECGEKINVEKITHCTQLLKEAFTTVILEGAGGALVPITRDLLFLDYIASCNYPLIIVATPKLGSINHTLLTLEAVLRRNMKVAGIVYNCIGEFDQAIMEDSLQIIRDYLHKNMLDCAIIKIPQVQCLDNMDVNFSPLFAK